MNDDHYAPNDLFARAADEYWNGIDRMQHETDHFFSSWPMPTNPFYVRIGKNIGSGYTLPVSTPDALRDLIAGTLMHRDNGYVRFHLHPSGADGLITGRVVSLGTMEMPPICADNAGAYDIALKWAISRGTDFYLTCATHGEMWIDA